jgi:hypothetical protein
VTAVQLLAAVRASGCKVDPRGTRLAIYGRLPAELKETLLVLHVVVRGLVVGKRVFGYRGSNGRGGEIDPAKLLPPGVNRLCVEGDAAWDVLPQSLVERHPHLFEGHRRPDAA